MLRLQVFAQLLLLAFPVLLTARTANPPTYDLEARIDPDNGSIAVRGTVGVPIDKPAAPNFKFTLHETFSITKLTVNGKQAKFSYVPMEGEFLLPASRSVVVELPTGISGDRVQMKIRYAGRMKVLPEFNASPDLRHSLDDQINSRMVELAGYSSWYPQFLFGEPLEVKLTVSLPQNWTTICSGAKIRENIRHGRVVTRWSSPEDMDLVVLASPNYKKKIIEKAGVRVELYYTQLPEQFIARDGSEIADALKFYSEVLGEPKIPGGTVRHVFSPKRKGQGKAGIARPGLVATSEGLTLGELAKDPNFTMFQWVAHEVAHYWWNFGTGQGDWVNEAFAEYYSAMAVQKLASEKDFQKVMADYRKEVDALPAAAPSLSTVPRWQEFVVRYYKGSLMLDAFRRTVGDEKFLAASREFYQAYTRKPTGTAEFRAFWKAKFGEKAAMVDEWLDSSGGMPGGD